MKESTKQWQVIFCRKNRILMKNYSFMYLRFNNNLKNILTTKKSLYWPICFCRTFIFFVDLFRWRTLENSLLFFTLIFFLRTEPIRNTPLTVKNSQPLHIALHLLFVFTIFYHKIADEEFNKKIWFIKILKLSKNWFDLIL